MTDQVHKVLKLADYNRWTVGLVLLAAVVVGGVAGCEFTTPGMTIADDGSIPRVTRPELDVQVMTAEQDLADDRAELDAEIVIWNNRATAHQARAEAAYGELIRKEELRAQVVDLAGGAVLDLASGKMTTSGLLGFGGLLLSMAVGFGRHKDARRKDGIIAGNQTSTISTAPEPPVPPES